jgi:hypothetical protein
MPETSYTLHGLRVLECAPDGKKLRTDRDAVDLIGVAFAQKAEWIVIPVERLEDDFFRLGTRIAGEIIQKFVNYKRRVAIIGDISRHVAESSALRDFVYETNRGDQIWFLASIEELDQRLATLGKIE